MLELSNATNDRKWSLTNHIEALVRQVSLGIAYIIFHVVLELIFWISNLRSSINCRIRSAETTVNLQAGLFYYYELLQLSSDKKNVLHLNFTVNCADGSEIYASKPIQDSYLQFKLPGKQCNCYSNLQGLNGIAVNKPISVEALLSPRGRD